jgi:hypothetical protein
VGSYHQFILPRPRDKRENSVRRRGFQRRGVSEIDVRVFSLFRLVRLISLGEL